MNRPNKKDYLLIPNVDASVTRGYYMDLEKYCDYLEARCLSDETNLQFLDKDIVKLEKALNKASELIRDLTGSCPLDINDFEVSGGCDSVCHSDDLDTAPCWREWLLKNYNFLMAIKS